MAHAANHTRLVIFQDIARHFAQHHPATHGLIVPAPTTAGGSTTTLVDTKLGRGNRDPNFYDGCTVIMVSGTQAGDIATVNNAGFNGTSQLTFSPAMGGSGPGSGDNYVLLPPFLAPETVHDEINRVLRETYGPHIWIPSLVPDGDFDENQLTNFPQVLTPTTREFVTTPANVLFGDRSLHVVADETAAGAESLTIAVTDVETVLISVFVQVLVGTMDVVTRNHTASSDMSTKVIDEEAWTEVRFIETIAAAQQQLRIRFQGNANLDEFNISAFVTVQAQNPRPYFLPSWFVSLGQYMGALTIPPGLGSEVADSYVALSGELTNANIKPEFIQSASAVHPFMVQLPGTQNDPIALVLKRAFSELATDSATTHADRTFVVKRAIANIRKDRGEPDIGNNAPEAARLADALNYGRSFPVMEEGRLVTAR